VGTIELSLQLARGVVPKRSMGNGLIMTFARFRLSLPQA
jgi:hypothetical protein